MFLKKETTLLALCLNDSHKCFLVSMVDLQHLILFDTITGYKNTLLAHREL